MNLESNTLSPREFCWTCRKAKITCVCALIHPFQAPVDFVFLVHPRESRNSVGTARIAHLSLIGSRYWVGHEFASDPHLLEVFNDPGRSCSVLFPGPRALDLSSPLCTPSRVLALFPPHQSHTLFVIDGTWDQAKGILRRTPQLQSLPQVCFSPKNTSRYQIRIQPKSFCLSTIEAVDEILTHLDHHSQTLGHAKTTLQEGRSQLLNPFLSLVQKQVGYGELNLRRKPRTEGARMRSVSIDSED